MHLIRCLGLRSNLLCTLDLLTDDAEVQRAVLSLGFLIVAHSILKLRGLGHEVEADENIRRQSNLLLKYADELMESYIVEERRTGQLTDESAWIEAMFAKLAEAETWLVRLRIKDSLFKSFDEPAEAMQVSS